tara:strand:+ start:1720 stop:1914 length:195 start_codon:yes stop_codon:yes gene_type:complete
MVMYCCLAAMNWKIADLQQINQSLLRQKSVINQLFTQPFSVLPLLLSPSFEGAKRHVKTHINLI